MAGAVRTLKAPKKENGESIGTRPKRSLVRRIGTSGDHRLRLCEGSGRRSEGLDSGVLSHLFRSEHRCRTVEILAKNAWLAMSALLFRSENR